MADEGVGRGRGARPTSISFSGYISRRFSRDFDIVTSSA
jgi:hypothetical protein